jgi:TatD DNase family protein
MAISLADAGYLISFALPVSFPKNIGPREAAAAIPAASLLVETDSPYLGVSRDDRNEPTTVLRTAAVLARLRDTDPAQIGAAAAVSYRRLFVAGTSTGR